MKIRIEIDENYDEDEVVIKCREMDENIKAIHKAITNLTAKVDLMFYKNQVEYFLSLSDILFFETSENEIDVHTINDIYQIRQKLYELESILPNNFIRVSKSTILNVNHICSIDKNLASSSLVQFNNTHKKVYVSRNYFKNLRLRISERRNYE